MRGSLLLPVFFAILIAILKCISKISSPQNLGSGWKWVFGFQREHAGNGSCQCKDPSGQAEVGFSHVSTLPRVDLIRNRHFKNTSCSLNGTSFFFELPKKGQKII